MFLQEQEEKFYRAYVTDALLTISKNTAKIGGGEYASRRWIEGIPKVDNRTGDDIAFEVITKLGLKFKDGE